jgi:hypothetical protein
MDEARLKVRLRGTPVAVGPIGLVVIPVYEIGVEKGFEKVPNVAGRDIDP